MKKQYILLAACLAVAACAKEGIEPDYVPEYYTFNAVLEDATKVEFADKDASTKYLQLKDGDKVGYTYTLSNDSISEVKQGTISVDGNNVTVTLDLAGAKAGWESILDIWYPYNEGSKLTAIPTTQTYDAIAVPIEMKSKTASSIEFQVVPTVEYVVLEFPIEQISYFITKDHFNGDDNKDYIYYDPVSSVLKSIAVTIEGSDTYTLNIVGDEGINLKSLAESVDANNHVTATKTYYIVIPPISSKAITVAYTHTNMQTYNKRKSGLSLSNKDFRRMPRYSLSGYHFWNFGSLNNNTDPNGLVYWYRNTDNSHQEISSTYVSLGSDYMKLKYNLDGSNYRYNFSPLWNNRISKGDGTGLIANPNKNGDNIPRITLGADYPVLAICMEDPKYYAVHTKDGDNQLWNHVETNWDPTNGTYPEAKGSRVFVQAENSRSIFCLGYNFSSGTLSGVATGDVKDIKRIQCKIAISIKNGEPVPPEFKVYWAGTFKSEADAKDCYDKWMVNQSF